MESTILVFPSTNSTLFPSIRLIDGTTRILPDFISPTQPTSIVGDRPVISLFTNGPLLGLMSPYLEVLPNLISASKRHQRSTNFTGKNLSSHIPIRTIPLVSTCTYKIRLLQNKNVYYSACYKTYTNHLLMFILGSSYTYRATNNDGDLSVPLRQIKSNLHAGISTSDDQNIFSGEFLAVLVRT